MHRHIKAGKVDVATIHDVDGSGFRQDKHERRAACLRDVDKTRNVAPQVEQRVHLHRRLGGAGAPTERPTGNHQPTPVAPFVGIGQRRAPDRLAEAHVIEFRCVDREAGLDVAQAFPVGQLGEGHGPVLLGAGKRPDPVIAAIPVDDPRESSPWRS